MEAVRQVGICDRLLEMEDVKQVGRLQQETGNLKYRLKVLEVETEEIKRGARMDGERAAADQQFEKEGGQRLEVVLRVLRLIWSWGWPRGWW